MILGDQPLNDSSDLGNTKDWLLAKNCSTLRDISSWSNDEEESWERWNLGNYPHELKEEAAKLLELLQGKSPISVRTKDKRSWGSRSGKYTAAEGYAAILEVPWVPPNPGPWEAL